MAAADKKDEKRYSCNTASETIEWMNAIFHFIEPYKPLIEAHVVNFFKDRLWELVDIQWMECLRNESVHNLLGIPCGLVQDYWPDSLQEFVLKLRPLSLPRNQNLKHDMLPNIHFASLGTVLSQGMNSKKKHEVEILGAIVNVVACSANAETIVDVGSGQGYLAQALSFIYQHSVIAIDVSLHHSTVTAARAERIKKYYAAKLCKNGQGSLHLKMPQVVTSRVLSSDSLIALCSSSYNQEDPVANSGPGSESPSMVLAGLHACGDLSASMLRTFVKCKHVKALISIGCCYNLLSEECSDSNSPVSGFPMSTAAKLSKSSLGKNARDLACQSAERWRNLTKDAAVQNFELHTFRAAFQVVLEKHHPEVLNSSPSIGRQGKALRRQQLRKYIDSQLGAEQNCNKAFSLKDKIELKINSMTKYFSEAEGTKDETITVSLGPKFQNGMEHHEARPSKASDKYANFKRFCEMGQRRLNFGQLEDKDLLDVWREFQPFWELVGPFWSLRAALGQLVETYILLDRLLFIQEEDMEAFMLPIFDPNISPRNVAIVALKSPYIDACPRPKLSKNKSVKQC